MWNGRVDVLRIQPSTVSFGAVHIVDVLLCDPCDRYFIACLFSSDYCIVVVCSPFCCKVIRELVLIAFSLYCIPT